MASKQYPHLPATDKIGVPPGPFVNLFDQLDQTRSGISYVGDYTEPPACQGKPSGDPAHDMKVAPTAQANATAEQCRACYLFHLTARIEIASEA